LRRGRTGPAAVVVYVLNLVLELIGFIAWLVIVITGKQPKGLQDVIRFCVSYHMRVTGLFLLVTETYPPFSDDEPGQITQPEPVTPLPAQPETPGGFEPPKAPEPANEEEPPPPPATAGP